jgi:hypothetical protein
MSISTMVRLPEAVAGKAGGADQIFRKGSVLGN